MTRTQHSIIGLLVLTWLGSLALPATASPAVGSPAPAFNLTDQDGQAHSLKEYAGHWLVMYFYPKDETPGCTTEACELRDNIFAYKKMGVSVVGVSVDDVESHKKFAEHHHLPFPLLADASKATARDYGVLVKMMGMFEMAERDTFIIDPKGNIAAHFSKVDPKTHSGEVLKALAQLTSAH
jgi:thioredoxin-dependent peroxiredoxin